MFDLEKFRTGDYYVHLPTQELHDEAMKFLDSRGFVWGVSRSNLNSKYHWHRYKEEMCIVGEFNDGVRYADEQYYIREGYKKLEINKFEKGETNMNEKIKRDLIKLLFEKEYRDYERGSMYSYKGRIITDYLHRTARFIDFIDKIKDDYGINGNEVAEIIIEEFELEEYKRD